MVAVGDGALGFWAALRTVWPETTEARCWVHKVANCLNALPSSVQPTAKRMLAEIRDAEDREHALKAIDAFSGEFAVKWPKAVAKIVDDAVPLLAFYDFPAQHWVHLKTTNPIESTFATVRLRTKVTKGPGSRAAGLAMAFKLIEAAEHRWRSVNAPHLVALVRAGAKFDKRVMVKRPARRIRKPPRDRRVMRSTGLDYFSSPPPAAVTCVVVRDTVGAGHVRVVTRLDDAHRDVVMSDSGGEEADHPRIDVTCQEIGSGVGTQDEIGIVDKRGGVHVAGGHL
jgi:hypothetical protein